MKTIPLPLLLLSLLMSCWAPLALGADDEKEEKADAKEYRTFKRKKDGKGIKAIVLSRIDDERYLVELSNGKEYELNVEDVSEADARYLEFWEPSAALDLKSAKLNEVLEQMGYATLPLISSNDRLFVNVTIDGKEGLFVLDPGHKWSTLDAAVAAEIGMKLGQGGVTFNDGKGGSARSQKGPAKSLRVGSVELKSHSFEVIALNMMIKNVPGKTIGAIGSTLLTKLNALVDHEGKRLFIKMAE